MVLLQGHEGDSLRQCLASIMRNQLAGCKEDDGANARNHTHDQRSTEQPGMWSKTLVAPNQQFRETT